MVRTLRPLSTSRAGIPSARIQSSARHPRMIAAVLTVLAAKQVCAATLTVRHNGSADHPVRGRGYGGRGGCAIEHPQRIAVGQVLERLQRGRVVLTQCRAQPR